MNSILKVRGDDLAHETIDGETIVIDLRAQTYYRLEGPAAAAWHALCVGCDAVRLTALLQERFPEEAATVAQAVPPFLDELQQRGLLQADAGSGGEALLGPAPASLGAFAGLVVHSFADLEEILWVDPVHDVDAATGWPTLPPAG